MKTWMRTVLLLVINAVVWPTACHLQAINKELMRRNCDYGRRTGSERHLEQCR